MAASGEDTSSLMLAVEKGDTRLLYSILLEGCEDINDKSKSSRGLRTALHVAVEKRNHEATNALLLAGGKRSIFISDELGNTPLSIVIKSNNIFALQLFLISLGSVNIKKSLYDNSNASVKDTMRLSNFGAQFRKIKADTKEKIRALEEASSENFNRLITLIKTGQMEEVKKNLLTNAGMASLYQNREGTTALHYAVESANVEILKTMLIAGARQAVFVQNESGLSPFDLAVQREDEHILSLLCLAEGDISPFQSNLAKIYAMRLAIDNCRVSRIRFLMLVGGNILATNSTTLQLTKTTLHAAAAANDAELVRFLLQRGADVNARDYQISTALHAATTNSNFNSHLAVVKVLLDYGADDCIKDFRGNTPHFYLHQGRKLNNAISELLTTNTLSALFS